MANKVDLAVQATLPLPGVPVQVKRGRKPSGNAMTLAQRQKKYRESHKSIKTGSRISATITRLAREFDLTEDRVTYELLRFALCNKNWFQTGFPSVR